MIETKRRIPLGPWLLYLGACTLTVGCDQGKPADGTEAKAEGAAKTDAAKTDAAKTDGEAKTDAAKADAAKPDAVPTTADALPTEAEVKKEVALFLKDQTRKGCEMLTPAMVAKVLEVPEGELDQQKIMGCIYSWEREGTLAQASIMSLWVKETPEQARQWFENTTQTKTAEELAAEMAKAKQMVAESKQLDTKLEQETASQVGDLIAGLTPDEGVRYEDVSGLGDAARVKTYDGTVTVLVGNLVFNIQAYKGAPPPPPDMEVMLSRDMKRITEATKQADAKLMDETRDVRRKLSIELAKQVVGAL